MLPKQRDEQKNNFLLTPIDPSSVALRLALRYPSSRHSLNSPRPTVGRGEGGVPSRLHVTPIRKQHPLVFWDEVCVATRHNQGRRRREQPFTYLEPGVNLNPGQISEEVTIPPAKQAPPKLAERLIPVTELEPLARASFPVGFLRMNSPKLEH